MDDSKFRTQEGVTEVRRKKRWLVGLNFDVSIRRVITGGDDQGGAQLDISTPLMPGQSFIGYLPEVAMYDPKRMHMALKKAFPDVPSLGINLSKSELFDFWTERYSTYFRRFRMEYGYLSPTVRCIGHLGWNGKTYMVNNHLQLDEDGQAVPPEEWTSMMLEPHMQDIPMPVIRSVNRGAATALYEVLGEVLHGDTYMAAVLMGGVAVTAVHYRQVKDLYNQVPIPVLLGPSNTGKSLLAKVCASLMGGLHNTAIYQDMTQAKLLELMGKASFFVYNDPEKTDVLKTLITKAYEDGKSSNLWREMTPNTVPVVTANPFIMKSLTKMHGMREISRLLILPLVDEAKPILGSRLNEAMDRAGQSYGQLVCLRGLLGQQTARVREVTDRLSALLPDGESRIRLAQNYAQTVVATELFIDECDIPVSREVLWRYVEEVLLPRSIEAHQLHVESEYDSNIMSLIQQANRQLTVDEFYGFVTPKSKDTQLAVRLRPLMAVMAARQTQQTFSFNELRQELLNLGGKREDSVRFRKGVLSAYVLPAASVDMELMDKIVKDGTCNGQSRRTGRPAKRQIENCREADVLDSDSGEPMEMVQGTLPKPAPRAPKPTFDSCPRPVPRPRKTRLPAATSNRPDGNVQTETTQAAYSTRNECEGTSDMLNGNGQTAATPEAVVATDECGGTSDMLNGNGQPAATPEAVVATDECEGTSDMLNGNGQPAATPEAVVATDECEGTCDRPNGDMPTAAAPEKHSEEILGTLKACRSAPTEDAFKKTLQLTRKRQNKKAASRQKKTQDLCGVCKKAWFQSDPIFWIQCDYCQIWFHGECLGVSNTEIKELSDMEKFRCSNCSAKKRSTRRRVPKKY